MKKFIIGASIRLGILAILLMAYAQFGSSIFQGNEYARWEVVLEHATSSEERRSIVLGDSRAEMGFATHKMKNTYNYALGGSTPVEAFYILRKTKNIDTVYLSFSPLHLFGQDAFHSRTWTFGLINRAYLDSVRELAAFSGSNFDSCRWSHWNRVSSIWTPSYLHDLLLRLPSMGNIENYKFLMTEKKAFISKLEAHHYSRLVNLNTCLTEGKTTEYDDVFLKEAFVLDKVNEHYLSKIKELCAQRRITLIWVDLPRSRNMADLSESYWLSYQESMASFMNTSYFSMRIYDSCLFVDANHLNEGGARYVTDKINKAVPKIGSRFNNSIYIN